METQEVQAVFDGVRTAIRESVTNRMGCEADVQFAVAQFSEALVAAKRQARKDGFDSGFQLAARVEQRQAKELLAQYALDVLGKDRADGGIDLGALGESVFANPRPETETEPERLCTYCHEPESRCKAALNGNGFDFS